MIELQPEVAGQLRALLQELERPVRLLLFTRDGCQTCPVQAEILELVHAQTALVSVEQYRLPDEDALAQQYGVDKVPATVVLGEGDLGIRFFGVTSMHEFGSLISAVRLASVGAVSLPPELQALLQLIDVPTHLEVMVTTTCPYCPKMVQLAHLLAASQRNIRADMVDAAEFPALADRYQISGVPRLVVNGHPSASGVLPPFDVVLQIIKVVKPLEYERIDSMLREFEGIRRARAPEPEHLYDTLIVGAGPAAFSAAIYAARKGMDVALIGDEPGGQLMKTATVENWLGVPQVDARELAEAFRRHAEMYSIAAQLHVQVTGVRRVHDGFRVDAEGGQSYRARTVIWAAGKEYRRLEVPGEERFLGRGIAFCATCDAPLFADKRVAVIGGGNSAFSAARDLLNYAKEIHVITTGDRFKAEPVLQTEVIRSPKVKRHMRSQVRAFLGEERLVGVRIASIDDAREEELSIDGAFLEIGLVPNTRALEGFIPLNARGEIPVDREQRTQLPGFYAAGDATDESQKQLMVAAGAGTKAALSAWDDLLREHAVPAGRPSSETAWDA